MFRIPSLLVLFLLAALLTAACAPAATPAPAKATAAPLGPAAPAQPTTAAGASALPGGSKQTADYVVTLMGAPNPPARSGSTLEAVVTDAKGQPVADAKVTFDLDMTTMSHGKNVVAAISTGNGHYAAQVSFPMAGPWRAIISVARGGQAAQTARFDFSVNR